MIGQSVSHYKILEKLGEGGMGVVYKAQDTKLDRVVALKFLPHHLTVNDAEKARFLQEAKAAATLNHPNVCVIHSIDEAEDKQFIVMEYVDGMTLRQKIAVRADGHPPLPLNDAISYAIQIGEALHEAHSKGIVHRDIKCENMMVNSRNQIKVMDFGLAKLKGSLKLTKATSTVGTLAYMAPEQIQGGEVDGRSDIFSFGVVLFEMLTGKMPFRGEHDAAIMYSILNEEPESLTKYVPDASADLLHILNRALEKDPGDRYQHVDDMVSELRRLRKPSTRVVRPAQMEHSGTVTGTGMPTTSPKKSNVMLWIAAAAIVLLAGSALFLFLNKPGHTRPKINPGMSTSLLQIPAMEFQYPDISPDGKWLTFPGSDVNGNWDIYMMFIETGESRRLTNDSSGDLGNAATARFSPDGSSIAYGRNPKGKNTSEVCVVSVLTGSSRVIADSGLAPSWNAAGNRIFYYRGGRDTRAGSRSGWREYWSVSPQGADAKIEFIDSLMEGSLNYFTFRVSPDDKKILFTRPMKGDFNEIFVRDLATGNETQLTYDGKIIDETVALDNGYVLYSSNRSGNFNIWAIPESGGESIQITKGTGPDYGISMSTAANRLIFSQRSESSTLWMVNTDGTGQRQIFPDDNIQKAHISPDGKTLALQVGHPVSGPSLMIRDLSGGRQEMLFPFEPAIGRASPVWSPTGQLLAYLELSRKDGAAALGAKIMDMAGGRRVLDLGEGIIDMWLSDSLVTVIRNTSNDKKRPKYNESHFVNIRTGDERKVFRDTTYAIPLLDNSWIGYADGNNNLRLVSRPEFARNPNIEGDIILKAQEFSGGTITQTHAYYVSANRSALWKLDLRTRKSTKVTNLSPGDKLTFDRADYADKVVTYTKHKRKTNIVKIDNLFIK